jgi:hypothetical protein
MLVERPSEEEAALWRAYADLLDKYVVGPAMAREKEKQRLYEQERKNHKTHAH